VYRVDVRRRYKYGLVLEERIEEMFNKCSNPSSDERGRGMRPHVPNHRLPTSFTSEYHGTLSNLPPSLLSPHRTFGLNRIIVRLDLPHRTIPTNQSVATINSMPSATLTYNDPKAAGTPPPTAKRRPSYHHTTPHHALGRTRRRYNHPRPERRRRPQIVDLCKFC